MMCDCICSQAKKAKFMQPNEKLKFIFKNMQKMARKSLKKVNFNIAREINLSMVN